MLNRVVTGTITLAIILGLTLLSPQTSLADYGYGGGQGHHDVNICKKTGSPFNPYVSVTVPEKIAKQFIKEGGVYPDSHGNCPKGISIRDYVKHVMAKHSHFNDDRDRNNHGNISEHNNNLLNFLSFK